MIMEVWFPDTDTPGKTMGKDTGNTARVCPITHSMPWGKGITDSSPCHTSRGNSSTGTIRDTAVIKAMDMDQPPNGYILMGQTGAVMVLRHG